VEKRELNPVYIFTELFHPDETSTAHILAEVASSLSVHKDVVVICGPASYQRNSTTSDKKLSDKIIIKRLSVPALNKDKVSGRLARMILLTIKMAYAFITKVPKNSTVLIVTNPAPLLVVLSLIKRFKKIKLVILVHDVFPENAVSAGILKRGSFMFNLLCRIYNYAYRSADELIVLGRDMKHLLETKTKHTSISIIPNWADTSDVFPVPEITKEQLYGSNVGKNLVILFAGNIGRVQGLLEFLQLFKEVSNTNLTLVIAGSGAYKPVVEDYVKNNRISNVLIRPQFSRSQQIQYLNACDLALVSLSKGMYGLGVPSKTYNIMAAAKPILFIGDKHSEIYDCVAQNKAGWVFDWEEKATIKHFLQGITAIPREQIEESGRNAYNLATNTFSKEKILSKFQNVLLDDV